MSFLFYDFETTGADPRCDRPVQFAALRTNDALEPIAAPITLYATLSPEVLPHPQAVLITGILPQTAIDAGGTPELLFAARIHREMSQPDTCAVGFNSLRFDAELLRFMFWRNLRDPYAHEWQAGNSRWDVLDAARVFRLLRPEGIQWPDDAHGAPTLRLTALTEANGISHANAHDAFSDVQATLDVARLLRSRSPKLFDYLLNLRKKSAVIDFVDDPERSTFVHISGRIASAQGNASVFANLGQVRGVGTQRLLWDLRFDPAQVLDESIETLSARRFMRDADAKPGAQRLPIKLLHLNRAPAVVSMAILKEGRVVEQMQLDTNAVQRHSARLQQHHRAIAEKLHAVLAEQAAFAAPDAECALYDGFIPNADRRALDAFNRAVDDVTAENLAENLAEAHPPAASVLSSDALSAALEHLSAQTWHDARLPVLVLRLIARTRPDLLDANQAAQWQAWLQTCLNPACEPSIKTGRPGLSFAEFFTSLDTLRQSPEANSSEAQVLLLALHDWARDHARQYGAG